jgi:hypothetical protein
MREQTLFVFNVGNARRTQQPEQLRVRHRARLARPPAPLRERRERLRGAHAQLLRAAAA